MTWIANGPSEPADWKSFVRVRMLIGSVPLSITWPRNPDAIEGSAKRVSGDQKRFETMLVLP